MSVNPGNLLRTLGFAASFVLVSFPAVSFGNPAIPQLFAFTDSEQSKEAIRSSEILASQRLQIRNRSIEKESLLRASDQRIRFLLAEGETALNTGRLAQARQSVEEALILNPGEKQAKDLLERVSKQDRGGVIVPDASLGLLEEDLARRDKADPEQILNFHLKRAEYFLKARRYDDAVEDLEQVFLIDPANLRASGTIDGARKTLIRETKEKAKTTGREERGTLAELFDVSYETARQLVKEGRFVEAKILLNRIALIEPGSKQVDRLMRKIQKEEKKRGESR